MQIDPSLKELISAVALERQVSLAHDTHYDADNWELFWWSESVRLSVDVQPYPDGRLEVSYVRTGYPFLPRLLAWAWRSIPMFPNLGRSQREFLGCLPWPSPPAKLRDLMDPVLPPNNSFKPNPLRGSA
jgi:hypothetical protein